MNFSGFNITNTSSYLGISFGQEGTINDPLLLSIWIIGLILLWIGVRFVYRLVMPKQIKAPKTILSEKEAKPIIKKEIVAFNSVPPVEYEKAINAVRELLKTKPREEIVDIMIKKGWNTQQLETVFKYV